MDYKFSKKGFNVCKKLIDESYSLSWILNYYCKKEMNLNPSEDICHISYLIKKLNEKMDRLESIFINKEAGESIEDDFA